jgi:restriction system protein
MSFFKGWFGEKKTTFNMWWSLDSRTYKRVHDLIIPSKNGTTQIDHVIISPFGIFIVETKNRTGWIFGSAESKNWTQVTRYDKYPFQNPLRQTYRQKKVLSEFLGIPEKYIHTIIYFVGDCRFKTPMPENVRNGRLASYIKRFRHMVLSDQSVADIEYQLRHHKTWSPLKKNHHIRSLEKRHNSKTHCPRCGSTLVIRSAKTGLNAGRKFYGCSSFPKCRFTKSI